MKLARISLVLAAFFFVGLAFPDRPPRPTRAQTASSTQTVTQPPPVKTCEIFGRLWRAAAGRLEKWVPEKVAFHPSSDGKTLS